MAACETTITRGPNKGQWAAGTRAGYQRHLAAGEPACDACLLASRTQHQAWRKANPEYYSAWRRANLDKEREADRAYYWANREKERARGRAYYEANRERLATKHSAYYRANRERYAELNQAYYETNRDRWRAYYKANVENVAERSKAWREANPEKRREYDRRRRARLKGVESDDYTVSEIFERDRGRCQLCGKKVNPDLAFPDRMSASIDHIVPLEHGGNDTRVNVQLTHLGCNASKQARTIPTGEQLRLVG